VIGLHFQAYPREQMVAVASVDLPAAAAALLCDPVWNESDVRNGN
jgi:hypothetical protein